VLAICDAIFGNASNNFKPPAFIYNGLLMSRDPVAVDALGLQILGDNGCSFVGSAIHIMDAGGGPYHLGTADVNNIDLVEITNPYTSGSNAETGTPEHFILHQNYPNPFNPSTSLTFSMDREAAVVVDIYTSRGDFVRRLANRRMGALTHTLNWDGKDQGGRVLPSGRYICRVRAGEESRTIRLVKVR